MNSMSLFKWKFFKENLRKSKGILVLLLGLLPLANVLVLLMMYWNGMHLVTFPKMSVLTYIGVFIVPLLLAFILFGFVFKKKSVDFYLAQPISRKSLFITNILGGVIILFLFILLNTILFFLLSLLTTLTIPLALLFDYFIYWLVAYLFMFIVVSLAIVFSGNILSALVVVAVLLLFYPFLEATNMLYRTSGDSYYYCDNENCQPKNYSCIDDECQKHLNKNEYEFHLFEPVVSKMNAPIDFLIRVKYDSIVVIKTAILTVIYLILGYYVFMHRKMENNETGFKNPYVHFSIKTLTFMPICFFTWILTVEMGLNFLPIAFVICATYYLLYDLITRREVYQLKLSICIFLLSYGILSGASILIMKEKTIVHKKIDSITFTYNDYPLTITDQELKENIIKDTITQTNNYNNYGDFNYYETYMKIKNKTYRNGIYVTSDTAKKLDAYIKKNNILNRYQTFDYNHLEYAESWAVPIPITKEFKESLKIAKETITEKISRNDIELYKYENHTYNMITIAIEESPEIYNYVAKVLNQDFITYFEDYKYYSFGIRTNDATEEAKIKPLTIDWLYKNHNQEFLNYLKQHQEVSYQETYYIISTNQHQFYISDVEDFVAFISHLKEN